MARRHIEALMDGVALSSLGPYLIQGVSENAPELTVTFLDRPGGDGQWLSYRQRRNLQITLRVAIQEVRDLARRSHCAEQLAAWACGSVLQLSNHPDRRLHVVLIGLPSLGDARNYTQELQVVWTAVAPPYWEDTVPTRTSLSGTSATDALWVPGTAETPAGVTVTPESALTDLTVTAGAHTIQLTELAVPAGTPLTFSRDGQDRLQIASGGVSLIRKRTAASADDLILAPGSAAVSFEANAACSVIFETRGRWQ